MTDSSDPAALLAEAQMALHNLKTGRMTTELEVDGRRVRYARTDIDKLEGYVAELQAQVAGRARRRGAIGFLL